MRTNRPAEERAASQFFLPLLVVGLTGAAFLPACYSHGGGGARLPDVDSGSPVPVETGAGQAGESCTAPADCESGLACVNNICTQFGGRAGESCRARSDCAEGLSCFNQVCVPEAEWLQADAGAQAWAGTSGESCQTRADCRAGLVCVNGVCLPVDYGIEPTGKRCVVIECLETKDCCDPDDFDLDSPPCSDYSKDCNKNPKPNMYCDMLDLFCKCVGYECVDQKCVFDPPCQDASTCSVLPSDDDRLYCSQDGVCVQCEEDGDCEDGRACRDNRCVEICENDLDCDLLHECQDGSCVEVGCTVDRECIAERGDIHFACRDGECVKTCETDPDCGLPHAFEFLVCRDGYCVEVGCETDEECRARAERDELPATPTSSLPYSPYTPYYPYGYPMPSPSATPDTFTDIQCLPVQ